MSDSFRFLRCQQCCELVQVYEVPVEHIDPALFVCADCGAQAQAQLLPGPRKPETRRYEPKVARIPFGDPTPAPFTRPEPQL